MIYLISKIVLSLLAALGIGFGMAWMLQMHLAARLREQLNSVIFETKSRIPQLETEITARDQTIDQLREELAKKPKSEDQNKSQAGSKEQEKQIDELRQQVIDLENELRMARGVVDGESVLEIDESDRVEIEEPELMSDDEFLADIQDIFEDADDTVEVFGSGGEQNPTDQSATDSSATPAEQQRSEEDQRKSLEEELQNELDGWDSASDNSADSSRSTPTDGQEANGKAAARKQGNGSVDLKAELLGLEGELSGDEQTGTAAQLSDVDALREEVATLTEAKKDLGEVVDTQAKEVASLQQQRDLQEKSLTVLNQQLELARMANERILRELRELKDAKGGRSGKPRSASNG